MLKTRILLLSIFLIVSCAFFFYSCTPRAVNHDQDFGGVGHSDLLEQGVEKCEGCHGNDLKGRESRNIFGQLSTTESCYECHENLWNLDEHQITYGGVRHQSLYTKSGFGNAPSLCGSCHGDSSLAGKGTVSKRPSCYTCHNDIWTPLEIHTINQEGKFHASGLFTPESNCITCHGSDLKGEGSAPSCYSCHENKWSFANTHTLDKDGSLHAPELFIPTLHCVACHGSNLTGSGSTPSCFACHGDKWSFTAVPHAEDEDGALHASGLETPFSNCVSCHGADLRGYGNNPSCYKCHDDKWNDD